MLINRFDSHHYFPRAIKLRVFGNRNNLKFFPYSVLRKLQHDYFMLKRQVKKEPYLKKYIKELKIAITQLTELTNHD